MTLHNPIFQHHADVQCSPDQQIDDLVD
jgi:hypothetical protein